MVVAVVVVVAVLVVVVVAVVVIQSFNISILLEATARCRGDVSDFPDVRLTALGSVAMIASRVMRRNQAGVPRCETVWRMVPPTALCGFSKRTAARCWNFAKMSPASSHLSSCKSCSRRWCI